MVGQSVSANHPQITLTALRVPLGTPLLPSDPTKRGAAKGAPDS
jgi:hypothetical protein